MLRVKALMRKNRLALLFWLFFLLFSVRPLQADSPPKTPAVDSPVRVGIYQNKPLIFTGEDGTVKGIYADILGYVAEQESWRIEYVSCDWAQCLERLEKGEIDLLTSIAYSEARDEKYDFNDETVLSNWGQVYAPGNSDIQSILDLGGKRIAVLENDIHALKLEEVLNEFRIESDLVKVQSYATVFGLIEEQKVDAGVVNRLFAAQNERDYGVVKTSIIFNPLEIRFAAPEGENQSLLQALDKHLAALRTDPDSIYYQSLEKWIGFERGSPFKFPEWLKWALILAGALIMLFVMTTFISSTQVRLKTAELVAKNQELRREIAEREQAEMSLRKSEEKYRSLFDSVPVGLYRSTPEGKVLDANLAMARMMGYSDRDTLLTADASEIYVTPGTRQKWQKLIEQEGVVYDFEAQWIRRDGAIIWIRDSAQLIRNDEGQILYYNAVIEDITAQKRAEEEASRHNRELSLRTTAIEQSAEGMIITDTSGKILYVNSAFERISGYSYGEAIGQTPQILKSGKEDRAVYRELWKTIESGRTWRGRLTNKRKDGSFYIHDASVTPVRNEAGEITHYVSVQRDVTQMLELEQQYRQAQKMEAIGRLTGGIAHDFNNLLTAINGYAELTKRELPSDSPLLPMVDNILGVGQRGANLVRQLLAFSRKQIVEPAILDLNMIVTDTNEMLQRIIGEHIEMTINLAPDLWPIEADATQIEQVLMNLVVNARDAMPQGGDLVIETANIVLDEEIVGRLVDLNPGSYVMLNVRDTGEGMDEAVKSRLFEPFFSTKEVGKGTGLGLATVFGIVKQGGGHILVDSALDQGTAFTIYLPAEGAVEARLPRLELEDVAPIGAETVSFGGRG